VLCGLEAIVATASCAEIASLELDDDGISFAAKLPVLGVLVTASTMPIAVDEGSDIELLFCAQRLLVVSDPDPEPDPDPDPVVTTDADPEPVDLLDQDPVVIATGGGPPVRTPLSLLAFVVLAFTGSTALLLWPRE